MELSDVGERVFAAEYILNRRVTKGHVEYLIKWKGWGNKHNTWEPERNIIDKRLIKEFHEKERRKAGVVRAQKSTSKAKMIVRSEKRPRGRPPLASSFKGQIKRGRPPLSTRPMKRPNAGGLCSVVKPKQNKKEAMVDAKVRGTLGPRGMDRLFVKRPGQGSFETVSTKQKEALDDGRNAPLSPSARAENNVGSPAEGASGSSSSAKKGPISGLASLTWQPASKRVLDAVCVTDVTAGSSGFTVTVRESSVVDGFFRSYEAP